MRQHVIKKKGNSMKWPMSCSSILLPLLLVTSCQSFKTGKSATVALYSDKGADEDCITATQNMFQWMGYKVELVKANDVNKELDNFSILCIPGGDMYQYSQDISSEGKKHIKNFISDGGAYIGICGGAYFTGEKVFWRGTQLPMTPLAIFPGITKGPIDEIVPYPNYGMCKVNIVDSTHAITQSGPDSLWILYYWGPVLIPNNDVDVNILGRYAKGKKEPVIIAFDYGEGRVFLTGTHPEFEEDSDRDKTTFADSLDDKGSDWDFMKKAVQWCLKNKVKTGGKNEKP